MVKTIAMERGSSELYSWLIRVYGYESNWKLFLDNWLFGVGFFSGQYHTRYYNELGLPLGAENYFLETAVGLGVIGLALFILCAIRVYQLSVVKSAAPPGRSRTAWPFHGPPAVVLHDSEPDREQLVRNRGAWPDGPLVCAVDTTAHLSLRQPAVATSVTATTAATAGDVAA
jgi:hypothetical protein